MGWRVELLKQLVEHDVRFVVVGGVAAIAHGSARVTEDLDICAPLNHENAVKIIRALSHANPRWRMRPDLPGVTPDHPQLKGLKNMYPATDLGQLDVLGELMGVGGFVEAEGESEETTIAGVRCRVLNLDRLIEAKRAAGRPKDRVALRELEVIRELKRKSERDQGWTAP